MVKNTSSALFVRLSACIGLFVTLLYAQQEANFFYSDSTRRIGTLQEIRNDTVRYTVTNADSTESAIAEPKSKFTRIVFTSGENLNLNLKVWPEPADNAATPTAGGAHKPNKRPTIAIAEFDGRGGVTANDASTLSDRFRESLIATDSFRVMERNQMELILKEQGFQQTGACKDNECLVTIGQLIAVQKIISGSVSRVGGMYTVSVKLLSVKSGVVEQSISEDCDCTVEELLTRVMERLAKRIAGIAVEASTQKIEIKRGDASLFIKTDPDSARIFIDGKLVDGITPITIDNLSSGEHSVKTTRRDLSGFATIILQPNKVGRLDIKLFRQQTVLKVASNPSEAEVYLIGSPKTRLRPDQITPAIFEKFSSNTLNVTLFKTGYFDTTLAVKINNNEINNLSVNLREAPLEVVKMQKKLVAHKAHRRISPYFNFPGAACLVGGGVFYYLAQKDFDVAASAKQTLEKSSILSGPEYDALVKKNRDNNDAGNLKTNVSYGFLGTGAALMGVGLVLYF